MRSKSYRFLLCLILLCVFIPYSALAALRVTFLDAGAGGAVLLQADGQTALINAGTEAGGDALLTYLADFDIPRIDLVANTLPGEDSIYGISSLLSKYEIGSLWLPDAREGEQLQASGIKAVTPVPGDQMDVGSAKVTVIGLKGRADGAAPGFALRVEYGGHIFLFLPGADALDEGALPESGADLHADVLSAGGGSILPQALLDTVSPLWAVAGGELPTAALARLQAAGILALAPARDGTVTFTSDGTGLQAEHEGWGVVVQSSVNLRKEASTKAGRAATLSKGSAVGILGTAKGAEGLWYHVDADGKVGFVRGDLIREVSQEEAEKLLAEATPKPKRSNNGGGKSAQEEPPADCH